MKFLAICLLIPLFLKAETTLSFLPESSIEAIYLKAERGDPHSQCIIGILHELGESVSNNPKEAFQWYQAAAQQGCAIAQKRLGVLYFFGKGTDQDKVKGFALVLASSLSSPISSKNCVNVIKLMVHGLTQDEIEKAFDLAAQLICENYLAHSLQGFMASTIKKSSASENIHILQISDRWDPADENERVYGPGTFDGNTGMLKSDYLELQREIEHFIGQLNDLKEQVTSLKSVSLQEKIETLKKEVESLQSEAFKDALKALLEAMLAGLSVEVPPGAILSGLGAINNIKDAAEKYCQSIDVKQEIERLMEMESSLESAKELERDNDRRGR